MYEYDTEQLLTAFVGLGIFPSLLRLFCHFLHILIAKFPMVKNKTITANVCKRQTDGQTDRYHCLMSLPSPYVAGHNKRTLKGENTIILVQLLKQKMPSDLTTCLRSL